MRKYISKKSILILTLALLLTVAVGSTLAYIFMRTDPVNNTFTPAQVSCAVVENGGRPVTNAIVNTGSEKTNVQIKNTGDTDAYIRVAIVITWKNDQGVVWAEAPTSNDYTIEWNLTADGWVKGPDGYYYYTQKVAPHGGLHDGLTDVLITSCTPVTGNAPEGYVLSVEIVASAIQASPDTVVEEQWKTGVSDANNGTLKVKEATT